MKIALMLLAAAASVFAQQPSFDFKLLDKLGANARESNNITLDANTLQLASGLLGDDKDNIRSIVRNLKGIYIRNFEFKEKGQYDPGDLAPLRAYLKSPQWNKIVETKEEKESTEIYLQPAPNNRLGGLALISAEPKELTVIFISGDMNLADLNKLSGNFGLPDMSVIHGSSKKEDQKKD